MRLNIWAGTLRIIADRISLCIKEFGVFVMHCVTVKIEFVYLELLKQFLYFYNAIWIYQYRNWDDIACLNTLFLFSIFS